MVICCHNQAVDASQTQARDMKLRLLLALNFFFFFHFTLCDDQAPKKELPFKL